MRKYMLPAFILLISWTNANANANSKEAGSTSQLRAPSSHKLSAAIPARDRVKIEGVAKQMKKNDVQTVIKVVENTDGNPCMPEGKSYQVDLQIKRAIIDHETNKIVYRWETVKTVGVDTEGKVMEI